MSFPVDAPEEQPRVDVGGSHADPVRRTGNFRLDRHKNVNKGIKAYGRLARQLVDYLLAIRPRNAKGYIHPNPATGKPYVDVRKQWDRLIAIASGILGYPLVNQKADFFTFRHTGATNIAQRASTRDELMRVVNMMGDTNVETVRRHYLQLPVRRRRADDRRLGTAAVGSLRERAPHSAARS
jgi:hypothetical protein